MLLYIMSRPHSGSTILNILLGNSSQVVSVGQLVSDMGKLDNYCSCGETIRACAFWKNVRQGVEAAGITWEEAVQRSVNQAHLKALWRSLWARSSDPEMRRLAEITAVVERAICQAAGKPHLCDSSKETTRALFLLRYYEPTRIIFLVRDPRAAVASHYWRFRAEHRFHFLRRNYFLPGWAGPFVLSLAGASWTIGNLLAELVRRVAPQKVMVLRYEDLRDQPTKAMRAIEQTFHVDLNDAIARIDEGDVVEIGHNIGGNQVRLESGLRFDPGKEQRRPKLPRWLEWTTIALCFPLMRRYGYKLRRDDTSTAQKPQSALSV